MNISSVSFKLILVFLLVTAVGMAFQTPSEDALREFQARIQHYLAIHQQASALVQPPPDVAAPAVIAKYQEDLTRAIRRLRSTAQRGDVFTRKARTYIANVINTKLDQNAKIAILAEGNPRSPESPSIISLAVNATYPPAGSFSTVPPSLLMALPRLPEELEYRFVGHTLILRDRKANMIVDIMTDAI